MKFHLTISLALIASVIAGPTPISGSGSKSGSGSATGSSSSSSSAPTARVKNGTLVGNHLDGFNQDVFLGIPFAQAPVDTLRFQPPQSLNTSWNGVKQAIEYGDACIATAYTDSDGIPQSEDCLSLNIVKPSGKFNKDLPVGIYIHGGGFEAGTSRSPTYNLSYIVEQSALINKPFIGVSLNYRLSGFGFLNSREVGLNGWTNVGLRDQIKAIEWLHENIKAFGGDPNHLVIWGESAGAISVGELLLNNVGDYVKGGILQSGGASYKGNRVLGIVEGEYQKVSDYFNCTEAVSPIGCLQKVDAKELGYVFNRTNQIVGEGFVFPYVDGDIISKSPYLLLENGEFNKVPILIGTNTDEGSLFTPTTIETEEDFIAAVKDLVPFASNSTIAKLDALYPSDDASVLAPLQPTYNNTDVNSTGVSLNYRRASTLTGDLMFAVSSRHQSKTTIKQNVPVYKYRFNIPDYSKQHSVYMGAGHGADIVYVFNNNATTGSFNTNSKSASVSNAMSRLWISFINDLNPNTAIKGGYIKDVDWSGEKVWSNYTTGKNLVFDFDDFYLENDTWREEKFEFIESVWSQIIL